VPDSFNSTIEVTYWEDGQKGGLKAPKRGLGVKGLLRESPVGNTRTGIEDSRGKRKGGPKI